MILTAPDLKVHPEAEGSDGGGSFLSTILVVSFPVRVAECRPELKLNSLTAPCYGFVVLSEPGGLKQSILL